MEINTERQGKTVSIKDLLSMSLQELPESFEDIKLTEDEREKVLLEAKVKKYDQVKAIRKKLEAEERKKDVAKQIETASGFWAFVKKRGDDLVRMQSGKPNDEFIMHKFQKHVIKALGYFFTENELFNSLNPSDYNSQGESFSLQKGIFMFGPPGVGKTLLMEMFRFNPRVSYNVIQCSKLAMMVSREGDALLNPVCKQYKNGSLFPAVSFTKPQEITGLCFNDLGTEQSPVNYYGNKINVMEQIILNTYDNKVPFWQRFITTNLTSEQLKELYGVRVTDRIRQMFNIIDLKGESLRK